MDYISDLKRVQSLLIKKFRIQTGEFLIEGEKIILEALDSSYRISCIWLNKEGNDKIRQKAHEKGIELKLVATSWLERAGSLKTNNSAVATVKLKEKSNEPISLNGWNLILDNISDPGNMGTIIRTADWYGLKNIICSENCVDLYNPKVLMASKGSFLRVNVDYTDLSLFLENRDEPVLAADMKGEDLHLLQNPGKKGFLILGNESHGIDKNLEVFITNRIHISGKGSAESLNVAIANAIILDNLNRLKVI